MTITDHAFRRYLERFYPEVHLQAMNEIEYILQSGIELDTLDTLDRIKEKYSDSIYKMQNGKVAVIENGHVITVLRMESGRWKVKGE